jgi:hypothetical protein
MEDFLMDIVVGSPTSVSMDSSEGKKFTPLKRERKKDRRKNRRDRRKSVREGIFVSLSAKNNKRMVRDRRRAGF